MSYELLIQEEVIIEIQEAFQWYEKQKPTLGYELIEEIENCYQKVCSNPEYYSYIISTDA